MEIQNFSLKCIKEVGSTNVISFKEKKYYAIDSIEPGIPGERTEELIVINELGNRHIVASDTKRIWQRDKWFNEHFEIVVNIKDPLEINVRVLEEMGYEVKVLNLKDCKPSKWNPLIEVDISKLKKKAEKAIEEKKYARAYKLLAKANELKKYCRE